MAPLHRDGRPVLLLSPAILQNVMVTGVKEFSFRPNPIGRSVRYRISQHELYKVDNGGRITLRLDLSQVHKVRWVETQSGGFRDLRLDLATPRETLSIHQTTSASKTGDDADVAAFLSAVRALIEVVGTANPDAVFNEGPSPGDHLLVFLVAIFYTALAVAVLVWFVRENDSGSWWLPYVGAAMIVLGVAGIWETRPWQAQQPRRLVEVAPEFGVAELDGSPRVK